jgi:hypothetical protein
VNSLLKRKKHPLRVHITLVTEGGTAAAMAIMASTFASCGTPTLFLRKEMLIKAKRKSSIMMRWDDPKVSGYIKYSAEKDERISFHQK